MLNNTQLKTLAQVIQTDFDEENTGAMTLDVRPSKSAPDDMICIEARIATDQLGDSGAMVFLSRTRIRTMLKEMGEDNFIVSYPITAVFKNAVHWDCYVHLNQ